LGKKEKLMQIGETAKEAGISRQSLQYYLMLGLMEATETTPTGRRLFDGKAVERIKLNKRKLKQERLSASCHQGFVLTRAA